MTINVLLETILGKSCLMEGTFGDSTAFTSNSVNIAEKLCDRLQSNGFERHGWETLYNGFTGEPINAKIFVGPTVYQVKYNYILFIINKYIITNYKNIIYYY